MRILVTGSRAWENQDVIHNVLDDLVKENCPALYDDAGTFVDYDYSNVVLIHGNCPTGADRFADDWAAINFVNVERHTADWRRLGKAAGHIRNYEMIMSNPDICLAFIRNGSRGSVSTAEKAEKAGITVRKFYEA